MNCILCGKEDNVKIGELKETYSWIRPNNFQVFDCNVCGTRFVDERGSPNYDFVYGQTDLYANKLNFARVLRRQEDPSWALIGLGHPFYAVLEFVRGKKNLEILEVGAGYGELSFVLSRLGHVVIGLDVSWQTVHIFLG